MIKKKIKLKYKIIVKEISQEALEIKKKNEYTKEDKQWLRLQLKEYSANNHCHIMTSRFSNETLEENKKYEAS